MKAIPVPGESVSVELKRDIRFASKFWGVRSGFG